MATAASVGIGAVGLGLLCVAALTAASRWQDPRGGGYGRSDMHAPSAVDIQSDLALPKRRTRCMTTDSHGRADQVAPPSWPALSFGGRSVTRKKSPDATEDPPTPPSWPSSEAGREGIDSPIIFGGRGNRQAAPVTQLAEGTAAEQLLLFGRIGGAVSSGDARQQLRMQGSDSPPGPEDLHDMVPRLETSGYQHRPTSEVPPICSSDPQCHQDPDAVLLLLDSRLAHLDPSRH